MNKLQGRFLGEGFRPQHDVFTCRVGNLNCGESQWVFSSLERYAEELAGQNDDVYIIQKVYHNQGVSVFHTLLGSMTQAQYKALDRVPQWVWECGLFSNGMDAWWHEAYRQAILPDWDALWKTFRPSVIAKNLGDSISIIPTTTTTVEQPSFDRWASVKDLPVIACPNYWPDGPNQMVRWR